MGFRVLPVVPVTASTFSFVAAYTTSKFREYSVQSGRVIGKFGNFITSAVARRLELVSSNDKATDKGNKEA